MSHAQEIFMLIHSDEDFFNTAWLAWEAPLENISPPISILPLNGT